MKIILKKGATIDGKKFPAGFKIVVDRPTGKKLIKSGDGEEGEFLTDSEIMATGDLERSQEIVNALPEGTKELLEYVGRLSDRATLFSLSDHKSKKVRDAAEKRLEEI